MQLGNSFSIYIYIFHFHLLEIFIAMAPRKGGATNKSGSKGAPKKRVAANGFKLPDPIAPGVIITDVVKKRWKIGHSIGVGGFGEIYLASDDVDKPVSNSADYVIKVEPHSNGPLFAEMHCYMRVARPEHIETWKRERKLKRLGMPKFLGSGSFEYNSQKFRFMVMERFGCDLQKILEQHSKRFSFKTVYQVGIQILDVLEYIHSKEYIHADIKASNLLIGYKPGTENQVFLVDFGLACRYANDGKHKEYKYDQRKAHDGTIEFTSRDAHIGAHSRRGDLEILGYNMTQWLCSCLPWEDKLQDCNYVFAQKRGFMEDVSSFISRCFPDTKPPGLGDYLEYVVNLAFDEQPDYEKCRNILREGLKARGYRDDGKLVFMSATPVPPKKTKSRIDRKVSKRKSEEVDKYNAEDSEEIEEPRRDVGKIKRVAKKRAKISIEDLKIEDESQVVEKENKNKANPKTRSGGRGRARKAVGIVNPVSYPGFDNPTPQMLALLKKKM